jgi:hypothetical protein
MGEDDLFPMNFLMGGGSALASGIAWGSWQDVRRDVARAGRWIKILKGTHEGRIGEITGERTSFLSGEGRWLVRDQKGKSFSVLKDESFFQLIEKPIDRGYLELFGVED